MHGHSIIEFKDDEETKAQLRHTLDTLLKYNQTHIKPRLTQHTITTMTIIMIFMIIIIIITIIIIYPYHYHYHYVYDDYDYADTQSLSLLKS